MEFPERRMLLKSPFCHVLLQCPQILGACQNVTASAILVGARHLLYILYVTNSEPHEFGCVNLGVFLLIWFQKYHNFHHVSSLSSHAGPRDIFPTRQP